MNFERNIERLDEIINTLEAGEISLDEAVRLYEDGGGIIAECKKALDEAQTKIISCE